MKIGMQFGLLWKRNGYEWVQMLQRSKCWTSSQVQELEGVLEQELPQDTPQDQIPMKVQDQKGNDAW